MATFLERYLEGDYPTVWAALVNQGSRVRQEPLRSDAVAVARETMGRIRHNIEILIERLDTLGYHFRSSRSAENYSPVAVNPFTRQPIEESADLLRKAMVHGPAGAAEAEQLNELEELAGALPYSIRAWYEIVGEVNLTGFHPHWKIKYLDPLVMPSLDSVLRWHRPVARSGRRRSVPRGKAAISLPDYVSKEGESGASYWIGLPCSRADAPLEGWSELTIGPEKTYFVEYLRHCIRFGGFPGFASRANLRQRDRAYLTKDLLPF